MSKKVKTGPVDLIDDHGCTRLEDGSYLIPVEMDYETHQWLRSVAKAACVNTSQALSVIVALETRAKLAAKGKK